MECKLALCLLLLLPVLAQAKDLAFVEQGPVAVTYGKKHRVTFDFGAERIGYVTVRGQRTGDGYGPVTSYVCSDKDPPEEDDVVFRRIKPPLDLSGLSFACSDGKLMEFWDDCLRLTENRLVAREIGDIALEAKYREELKTRFAEAMPKAEETENPLGVIVRKYLGVKVEKGVIEINPDYRGMVRIAGTVPTKLGSVSLEATHLPGNDHVLTVDVPKGAKARVHGKLVGPGHHEFRTPGPKRTFPMPSTAYDYAKLQQEKLDRGLVSFRYQGETCLSWRSLPEDTPETRFEVVENGKVVATDLIPTFWRGKFKKKTHYEIRRDGVKIGEIDGTPNGWLTIPLKPIPDGVTPTGEAYTYGAEDGSIGDLDGDGRYELVVKRAPSNQHDNSHNGYTGNTYLEAYALDGRHLWQIDLGPNIRSGAHYTQVLVYDFDGDGRAEVICKTAPHAPDYRNENGRVLDGPETLTVFEGATGKALATVPYDPPRGNVSDWGDDYGNRCDRFLAAVAYLDGKHPYAIFSRGYYAKTVIVAWAWTGKALKKVWRFDSDTPGNEAYGGQGFHGLRTGDVDFDGKDEVVFGSLVLDHDGKVLYSTGHGHGDGIHMSQMSPTLKGLQVYTCQESGGHGLVFRQAGAGRILWQRRLPYDVPMCTAADIDPMNPGYELWLGKNSPVWDLSGREVPGVEANGWMRDLAWWKGDLLRSQVQGSKMAHWNWKEKKWDIDLVLRRGKGNWAPNKHPVLVADFLGDWREEIVLQGPDKTTLQIFVSPEPTDYRFHSFLFDPVYRESVAGWNVAYNMQTHTGFYFGPDLLGKGIVFRGMKLE